MNEPIQCPICNQSIQYKEEDFYCLKCNLSLETIIFCYDRHSTIERYRKIERASGRTVDLTKIQKPRFERH